MTFVSITALRKKIAQLEELLANTPDEQARYRQVKKLNFLIMKLNTMRKSPLQLDKHQHYEEKIVERIEVGAWSRLHKANRGSD